MERAKSNIFVLVSIDEDLLQVYERIFVESQRKKGLLPKIYDASEVPFEEALSESDQGVLFGGIEFIWYRNLKNVSKEGFNRLKESLKENNFRNLFITVIEAPASLERWRELEEIPNIKLKLFDKGGSEAYLKHLISLGKREGIEITTRASLRLLEMCNGNFAAAYRELEKLLLYKYEEKKITEKDVIEFVSQFNDVKAFDFINSVFAKAPVKALREYLNIRASGENPSALFYLLLQQFSVFIAVATAFKAGLKPVHIANERGLKEWQVKKLVDFTRKWNLDELANAYWKLLWLDAHLKSGKIKSADLALKRFLLELLLLQPASSPA